MFPTKHLISRKRDIGTVKPRYPDILQTRKKCRHKWSVAVTRVGETYVYKRAVFFTNLKEF